MIVTTILAMALTAQAPTNEQQRQAELKALAAKIHRENLAKKPRTRAKPTTPPPPPIIQYVPASVETGAMLYVWTEGLERVPICIDPFRVESLQKSMLDDDQAALDEAIAKDRLLYVPRGAVVRVVQTLESEPSVAVSTATFAMDLRAANLGGATRRRQPACKVRILDGPFKDQSGWVPEYLLRNRIEVNLKKVKKHR